MADLSVVVRAIGRDELSGPFSASEAAIVRLGAAAGPAGIAVNALTIGLTALGAAGGVAAAGMAYATKEAGNLQQAVANVASIKPQIDTSGVFSSLNLMQTRVAQSSTQLAASLYDLFSSFEATQEQGLAAVEKFAQGAVAAQTDAKTFGTSILGVLNAYGASLEDVTHVEDVFFNTVKNGVVTGQELAQGLGFVTQGAKQAGLSINQLGAYIAAATREGGNAAENFTNLENYLQRVNAKETAAGFELLGIKTADANGKLRDNIEVLGELRTRLSQLNQVSATKVIQELFPDIRGQRGVTILLNQLDFLKQSLKENETEAGAAQRAYETMAAGFNTQAQLLGQTVNSVFVSGGSALLPVLSQAVAGVQKFVADTTPQFDEWQTRINAAFKSGGLQGWVDEVGTVAGELGQKISDEWLPKFTEWIEPAKEAVGNQIDQLWTGTIEPWIEQRAEDMGKKFTDEWAPALSKWIETDGTPKVIEELNKMADAVKTWAGGEGARKFNEAGGELLSSLQRSVSHAGVELHNEIVKQISQAASGQPSPSERAAGYANYQPNAPLSSETIVSGGMVVPVDVANQRLADAERAQAEYNGRVEQERAEAARSSAAAENTVPAGATRTGSGIGTGNESLDLAKIKADQEKAAREAEAARKKAEAEAKKAAEDYAALIAGFDRTAQEGVAALSQTFGEGARAAAALASATVAGAGGAQGNALAQSITELANEARKVGVPAVESLYADAMAAGRKAIVEGGEANKQAALASIQALADGIKAQNTLTPETWSQALGLAETQAQLGQFGGQFWETFQKATTEGGRATINQLATQRQSMAAALFQNRDLSPDRAQDFVGMLFGAIDNAIQNRGPQSAAELQRVLAQLNWDVPLEAAANRYVAATTKAAQTLNDAVRQLEEQRDTQLSALYRNRNEQEYRVQYLQGLQNEEKASLDVLASVDRAVRQSVQQRREDRDRTTQYAREDADQEIARTQQVEDAKARIRQAHDPKHDPLNPNGPGKGGFSTDRGTDTELAQMERQWAREDAIKATRRARDQEDVTQRRVDQAEDIAWANQYAGLVQTATDKFNAARDSFTRAASNADFNNQILGVIAGAETAETKANAAYAATVAAATEDYNRTTAMLSAMQQLAGISATAMDPLVAGANTWLGIIQQGTALLGGSAAGNLPVAAPTNEGTVAPSDVQGFAYGGSFTVGGAGGTDSQMVKFRATPGEKVTVGRGGDSIDYDKLASAIVRAFLAAGVSVNMDGHSVGKLVTNAQRRAGEQTLTYPSGLNMQQQTGVGGVGGGGY